MNGLKCGVPGCRTVIRAMTGFQELGKLRAHLSRAHLLRCDMKQALEWRERFERQQEAHINSSTPTEAGDA